MCTRSVRRTDSARFGRVANGCVFLCGVSTKRKRSKISCVAKAKGYTRNALAELRDEYAEKTPKGEIVVLIDRGRLPTISEHDLTSDLEAALNTMSMRDAVDMVAQAHDVPRRQVYQSALKLGKEDTT